MNNDGGAWSQLFTGGYSPTEQSLVYLGRLQTPIGRLPAIYAHDGTNIVDKQVVPELRDGDSKTDLFKSIARTTMPTFASSMDGALPFGRDSALQAITDLINWMGALNSVNLKVSTRTDRVVLIGDGPGAINVLNWAWRNPGKVVAVVLRSPIVALEDAYDRDAGGWASDMEAAYGGAGPLAAAFATRDPMRNLDQIRPFGDRIKIWYGDSDTVASPTEVQAFADLVGAETEVVSGGYSAALNVAPDAQSMWLFATKARRAYSAWDWQKGWDDLEEMLITETSPGVGKLNVIKKVEIKADGRRGSMVWPPGTSAGSGDRRVYPLPGFSAVDSQLDNVIYSGDTGIGGQQGNFHRIWKDPVTNLWQAHVAWQNFIFFVPWLLNFGIWKWSENGNVSNFTPGQWGAATLDHIRIGSGGHILATSRVSNIATYHVEFLTRPEVGDQLLIQDLPDASFNANPIVLSVTDNTFTASVPGPDTISGGGGGTFGNILRGVFPWVLSTRLVGSRLDWRVWHPGEDEPGWDDPDKAGTTTAPGTAHQGYGKTGFLMAHPGSPTFYQGRAEAYEL